MQVQERSATPRAAAVERRALANTIEGDRGIARTQCVGGGSTAAVQLVEARTAAAGTIDVVAARLWRSGDAAELRQRRDKPLAVAANEPAVEPSHRQAWRPLGQQRPGINENWPVVNNNPGARLAVRPAIVTVAVPIRERRSATRVNWSLLAAVITVSLILAKSGLFVVRGVVAEDLVRVLTAKSVTAPVAISIARGAGLPESLAWSTR